MIPARAGAYQHALAYYGLLEEALAPYVEGCDLDPRELCADAAICLEQIIDARAVRDWASNRDIQNEMSLKMEDYLYSLKGRHNLYLDGGRMDTIIEQVINTARHRM